MTALTDTYIDIDRSEPGRRPVEPFVKDHVRRSPSKNRRPMYSIEHDELRLLRALLSEPNKSAVAERLGCSTRHLRRRLQSLLIRLDVATTHAAVALAAWHGWLREEDLERLAKREKRSVDADDDHYQLDVRFRVPLD